MKNTRSFTSTIVRIASVLLGAIIVVVGPRLLPASFFGTLAQPDTVVAATLLETNIGSTLLNYQGRIANPSTGLPLADGNYGVNFFIFDAPTAGNQLWTEARSVAQARGLFVLLLGEVTPLPLDIFDGRDLYLQLQVNGDMLTSRQRIAWVAYAINARKAETANTVVDNAITSAKIADGQVFSADIADGTIGPADLADGAGSGIDADLLDGLEGSAYALASHTHSALPIAYGYVANTGARVSGTTNFSSAWSTTNGGRYEITITGEDYLVSKYTTMVTPVGGTSCGALDVAIDSVSNKLLVLLRNSAAAIVQCSFQFVTFK